MTFAERVPVRFEISRDAQVVAAGGDVMAFAGRVPVPVEITRDAGELNLRKVTR